MTLGNHQRRGERGLHDELLLGPLGGVWQGSEQLQSFGEVRHRFQIGPSARGRGGPPVPVGDRLRVQAGLGVVMRHQFGLRRNGLWEPCFQHLGDTLMVSLARAPQQRLIGRILDQGMLEAYVACGGSPR